tara:strand:+ start:7852 stop:8736 length:885 start_codon:yes stop_codon:yes gene_type:complete
MTTRTKETIENPEAEKKKEPPRPGGSSTQRLFEARGRGLSVDPSVTSLRKRGAYDISITHVPSDRTVSFPAFLTTISDGVAPTYGGEVYYGRMDAAPVYQNTTRTITVGFDVLSYSEEEARQNLFNINNLQSFGYPEYEDSGTGATTIKSPPLLRVKLANLICDARTGGGLLCYTSQISFDPDLNTYGAFQVDGNIIPKMYTITLSLTVLHEHELGWVGDSLRDPGIANGDFPRKLNSPQASQQGTTGGGVAQATPGIVEGTPAAFDPNADGVNTRQAGTEELGQANATNVLGG